MSELRCRQCRNNLLHQETQETDDARSQLTNDGHHFYLCDPFPSWVQQSIEEVRTEKGFRFWHILWYIWLCFVFSLAGPKENCRVRVVSRTWVASTSLEGLKGGIKVRFIWSRVKWITSPRSGSICRKVKVLNWQIWINHVTNGIILKLKWKI